MQPIRAPPGLEHLVGIDALHEGKLPFKPPAQFSFASGHGGLTSYIERTGENSPMKIRIGCCHDVADEALPPTSVRLPMVKVPGLQPPQATAIDANSRRLPRLGLQSAAYATSNICGWFSDSQPSTAMKGALPSTCFKPDGGDKDEKTIGISKDKSGNCRGPGGRRKADGNFGSGMAHALSGKAGGGDAFKTKAVSQRARHSSFLSDLLSKLGPECRDISLNDVLPYIVAVGQDQNGVLFLQARLLEASVEVKMHVINAILADIASLCTHRYGHTFIIQVMDVATTQQRRILAERLALQVKPISLDLHGCRVIQKALHTMPRDASEQLIQGLQDSVVQVIKSMHANHVIQVCIEEMPAASVMFIVHAVESWGVEAATTHIYGCRVIMRLLEHVPRPQMQRVLQHIAESAPKLAQDRYGNYVLQHVLQTCELTDKQAVMSAIIKAGASELAKQKYAHNVIEKCIELVQDPDCAAMLTDERLALNDDLLGKGDCDYVMKLAADRFGSMVVQCFLEHLEGPDLQRVRNVLLAGEEHLRNSPHTDALLAKLHVIL